jgi:hypothetical protein
MNVRVLIAALVGAVVSFFLGWVIYAKLVADFYAAHSLHYPFLMYAEPNLLGIFISGFAGTLLLAIIFNKWANITTLAEGAIAGSWIYLLIAISLDVYIWSTMYLLGKRVVIADIVINAVMGAVVGAIIAWVLGYKKSE